MVKQSICTFEDGAGQLLRLGQVELGQEEEISQGASEEPQSEQGSGQEAEAQETQKILLGQPLVKVWIIELGLETSLLGRCGAFYEESVLVCRATVLKLFAENEGF